MKWNTEQGRRGRSSALLLGGGRSSPPLGGEAAAMLRYAEGSESLGCLCPQVHSTQEQGWGSGNQGGRGAGSGQYFQTFSFFYGWMGGGR